jgi:glutamyl-Q tRNA(Asp) synthetase
LLQQHLAVPQPRYAHLPIAVTRTGEKLSKQTGANALDITQAAPALLAALEFLGQSPPPELARASVGTVWAWARKNWRLDRVARVRAHQVPGESSNQNRPL